MTDDAPERAPGEGEPAAEAIEEFEIVDHFPKAVWQGRDETNLACRGYRRETITCSRCANRFTYRYRILGVGTSQGDSNPPPDEAQAAYDERYRGALDNAAGDERRNFFRCPYCGCYQDWMKPRVARHRRLLARGTGRRLLVGAVVVLALIGVATIVLTAIWGFPWISY